MITQADVDALPYNRLVDAIIALGAAAQQLCLREPDAASRPWNRVVMLTYALDQAQADLHAAFYAARMAAGSTAHE